MKFLLLLVKNPHLLQSLTGVLALVLGAIGWYLGLDPGKLVPFLGAILGYTEWKKFTDNGDK